MAIPKVLARAKSCAKPCFLLLSRNLFGRSAVSWLQEDWPFGVLWSWAQGVIQPVIQVGLTECRGKGELAAEG